ncbi:rod shape-determining protein MreD [Allosphingosinicella humi]
MSRIALTRADYVRKELRRKYVPIASTVLACLTVLLPIVATAPLVPDFAFLVLIAWRLLRPEIWSTTTALPLGLFNDLIAGHPLGQSMALWTITFLAFDLLDSRMLFRDYWMDWFFAALAIAFYVTGGWLIGGMMGSTIDLAVLLPQLGASILAFPLVARLVLALDRWRLSR